MRSLRLAVAALGLVAATAFASPADPKLGAEYVQLASPQPTQVVGKKVEVIEFFMYHCPACNALEPTIAEWVKKQGDKINFKRVHMPYSGVNDPEAHLYLTLEAMGKLDEMHPKVFKAIHIDRVRMNKDDVVIDWAVKNGMDKAKLMDAWNSFGVMTKLKRLPQTLDAYKVQSVPTLVVDGRYMTSPSVVESANPGMNGMALSKATVQVLDAMVAKVAKTK
ncbi:disulfide bond formation protein DsbA [Massilia eurypsychrophila]|jgi:thiol:disulfide interchange protein DsbA|uniref:Thiol:disulfide interchange protein n=1 Tax=Massilia eurypsychrophila TaxID=1485217 RepID=A0A2G8TFM4_9BURK|nr:thiol:disulfide interchange protein DsbA/DsbL [Massilia eurypsychrophila]PIL44813.1 disulfide bond formation protein DsbA [Massilia eurypsychrophila]